MVKWLICGAILATALLLIKLRNLYRREKRLLRNDAKTGALTERGFIEALQDESKRSRRHLRPLTLVYVDLDNFSAVNGILGYDAGDAALKVVARTMRSTLREVDVVGLGVRATNLCSCCLRRGLRASLLYSPNCNRLCGKR